MTSPVVGFWYGLAASSSIRARSSPCSGGAASSGPMIAGRLDEAEAAAHALLRDYPDVIDGFDRLAMVYEARGDRVNAAAYYQKAADYIRHNADYFEPAAEADMRARADKFTSPH